MKPIERNPDIKLKPREVIPFEDQMPEGMKLIEGQNLHHVARSNGIPFGVASLRGPNHRDDTVGLVIRDEHIERFRAGMAVRAARVAKRKGVAA